jgi:hypothetical protein
MPLLAKGDDARLLWYANHAMGSGVSYQVVTITAVRDGAAWERLARRIQSGDLLDWAKEVDGYRHEVEGKILLPLPWSKMQDVDFDDIPTDGRAHETTLYMEDTMWQHEGKLYDYIDYAGTHYAANMPDDVMRIEAAFQPAFGTHVRREVSLMQKLMQPVAQLVPLLTTDLPAEHKVPGTWMHDALDLRDQWESKLLRTSTWSPLY